MYTSRLMRSAYEKHAAVWDHPIREREPFVKIKQVFGEYLERDFHYGLQLLPGRFPSNRESLAMHYHQSKSQSSITELSTFEFLTLYYISTPQFQTPGVSHHFPLFSPARPPPHPPSASSFIATHVLIIQVPQRTILPSVPSPTDLIHESAFFPTFDGWPLIACACAPGTSDTRPRLGYDQESSG